MLYPNSVLVDMEPKVVDECLLYENPFWRYNKDLAFTSQAGCGNNWALGYQNGL